MRFLIIFTVIILIYYIWSSNCHLRNNSQSFFRFSKNPNINQIHSADLSEPFGMLFEKYNIVSSSLFDAKIIFFHLLTDYQKLFHHIITFKKSLYIYSLRSIDILANKATLPQLLSLNKSLLKRFIPKTYVLDESNKQLIKDFDENKLYILKKNLQRQKGCTITNNINYIKNAFKNNYVVCQELLLNPYTINGHKINLRCYLLIVIKNYTPKFLLYNNGFLYYTPIKFSKKSMDKESHITTGLLKDRSIYINNPLTIQDLYKTLSNSNRNKFKKNLLELFTYLSKSCGNVIEDYDRNHHTNFVVMGVDIAVDNKLDCKIMELNKGPDLSFKDERDKEVKYNMMRDVLNELKLINHKNKNFIRLN